MITAPVVLFLDDGVNIFSSVDEAERWLEVPDIRDHPEWVGFDSRFIGIRPEIVKNKIQLRIDTRLNLEEVSLIILDQMRDYLYGQRSDEHPIENCGLSARQMFSLILDKVSRQ